MVIPQATDCADLLPTGRKERQRAVSCAPCQEPVDLGGWTFALTSQTQPETARIDAVDGFLGVDYSVPERALVFEESLISGETLARGERVWDH